MKRVILNIGELAVSKEPAMLETILGSCVAVCLWDRKRRIGGLNHYLLPFEQPGTPPSTVYGITSIDALVEQLLELGAELGSLQAHIFGGASVISRLEDFFNIGTENVAVAKERLQEYGIPVLSEHIRGKNGIRVIFRTATGEISVRSLGADSESLAGQQFAVAYRHVQPCKRCIECGSCKDFLRRRRSIFTATSGSGVGNADTLSGPDLV